jgi:hypothetical protein
MHVQVLETIPRSCLIQRLMYDVRTALVIGDLEDFYNYQYTSDS